MHPFWLLLMLHSATPLTSLAHTAIMANSVPLVLYMAGKGFAYISYQRVGGCNQQSVVFHTVKNDKEWSPWEQVGILVLKSSWPEILVEFQDFLKSFAPNSEQNSPQAEVFLTRKNLISGILGFPAGAGDHYLTFLTVYSFLFPVYLGKKPNLF